MDRFFEALKNESAFPLNRSVKKESAKTLLSRIFAPGSPQDVALRFSVLSTVLRVGQIRPRQRPPFGTASIVMFGNVNQLVKSSDHNKCSQGDISYPARKAKQILRSAI